MQSTGSKSKRPRKSAEEPKNTAQASVTPVEETTKIRRQSPARKTASEGTPAAKQHRGAAKKAIVPAVESPNDMRPREENITSAKTAPILHADIAALAYSYWAERGYQGGSAEEDWFRAEEQLSSRR